MVGKTLTIGVLSQEKMRARALAIAKGKYKPKRGEPKIWFPSMRSVAEVLSDENRALLQVIRESQPRSLGELSQLTGRQVSNLSRTLKTMANYGLIELKRSEGGRAVRPIVKAEDDDLGAAVAGERFELGVIRQEHELFGGKPLAQSRIRHPALTQSDDMLGVVTSLSKPAV